MPAEDIKDVPRHFDLMSPNSAEVSVKFQSDTIIIAPILQFLSR